eukprot:TRINITY_DN5113_c1_g1_i4.p1 TRINITY_DN5113_c1_g1~~TRINITY_DN5113_c1_g1_i4.p1  ORF type:complete len:185 (-),score=-1.86 TRINITY_DN5113_c1_g1_i4:1258-1773(-)
MYSNNQNTQKYNILFSNIVPKINKIREQYEYYMDFENTCKQEYKYQVALTRTHQFSSKNLRKIHCKNMSQKNIESAQCVNNISYIFVLKTKKMFKIHLFDFFCALLKLPDKFLPSKQITFGLGNQDYIQLNKQIKKYIQLNRQIKKQILQQLTRAIFEMRDQECERFLALQ